MYITAMEINLYSSLTKHNVFGIEHGPSLFGTVCGGVACISHSFQKVSYAHFHD